VIEIHESMRRFLQIAVTAMMAGLPLYAKAQSARAPRAALICAPCHGFEGVGHDSTVPNLAGQNREYLQAQLLAFRSGARRHPTMNLFSGQVTMDEIVEIADYYASLPKP